MVCDGVSWDSQEDSFSPHHLRVPPLLVDTRCSVGVIACVATEHFVFFGSLDGNFHKVELSFAPRALRSNPFVVVALFLVNLTTNTANFTTGRFSPASVVWM